MKRKTKRQPAKQWTPAFLRLKPNRDGQRHASGEAVLATMRDQQQHGQRRLSAWLSRANGAVTG